MLLAAYAVLYGSALGLAAIGLIVPAIALAAVAHGLGHTDRFVRVKPIRDIHG